MCPSLISTVPSKNRYDPGVSLCSTSAQQIVSFFTFSQSRVSGLQSVPLLADGDRVALFAPHYPQLCGSGFYCLVCSLQLRCNQEDRRIGFDQRFEAFLLFPGPSLRAGAPASYTKISGSAKKTHLRIRPRRSLPMSSNSDADLTLSS
jgi:hypothetical protein